MGQWSNNCPRSFRFRTHFIDDGRKWRRPRPRRRFHRLRQRLELRRLVQRAEQLVEESEYAQHQTEFGRPGTGASGNRRGARTGRLDGGRRPVVDQFVFRRHFQQPVPTGGVGGWSGRGGGRSRRRDGRLCRPQHVGLLRRRWGVDAFEPARLLRLDRRFGQLHQRGADEQPLGRLPGATAWKLGALDRLQQQLQPNHDLRHLLQRATSSFVHFFQRPLLGRWSDSLVFVSFVFSVPSSCATNISGLVGCVLSVVDMHSLSTQSGSWFVPNLLAPVSEQQSGRERDSPLMLCNDTWENVTVRHFRIPFKWDYRNPFRNHVVQLLLLNPRYSFPTNRYRSTFIPIQKVNE